MTKAALSRLVAIAAGAAFLSACTIGSAPQVEATSAGTPAASTIPTLPQTDGSFPPSAALPT